MLAAGAVGLRPHRQRPLRALRRLLQPALPQREQDIDKAKSLLKAAGQEDLTIDLQTTNGAAGMIDSAKVFAAQAKAAGSR